MEIIIIDSHNEILPYWFKEYLKQGRPLVVVRIDKHHDMHHDCPALPAREGRQVFDYLHKMMPNILEYAKMKLDEGNFTCPAFHYGIIGALYHFNPVENKIDAYGRVFGRSFMGVPQTKSIVTLIEGRRSNRIFWDKTLIKMRAQGGKEVPVPQHITLEDFKKDIVNSHFPKVIGFDLDGLLGIGEKDRAGEIVNNRLEKARRILESVSSPEFACIARSQTPRAYVPPEFVDSLQETVLDLIEMIYT